MKYRFDTENQPEISFENVKRKSDKRKRGTIAFAICCILVLSVIPAGAVNRVIPSNSYGLFSFASTKSIAEINAELSAALPESIYGVNASRISRMSLYPNSDEKAIDAILNRVMFLGYYVDSLFSSDYRYYSVDYVLGTSITDGVYEEDYIHISVAPVTLDGYCDYVFDIDPETCIWSLNHPDRDNLKDKRTVTKGEYAINLAEEYFHKCFKFARFIDTDNQLLYSISCSADYEIMDFVDMILGK